MAKYRVMQDCKKLPKVKPNLAYPKSTEKMGRISVILGIIIVITTIYLITAWVNQPLPETEQDQINMISPEIQSFLESYHQEVDEYGVE